MEAPDEFNQWFDQEYEAIKRIVAAILREVDWDHLHSSTDITDQVYLRLRESKQLKVRSPEHLRLLARRSTKWLLADLGRARTKVTFVTFTDPAGAVFTPDAPQWRELLEEIDQLARVYPRQAQVVEEIIMGGARTLQQVADALGLKPTTIKKDYAFANGWLTDLANEMGL